MGIPVTEEMCRERVENMTAKVDDIKDEVLKIRLLWTGNGKVGVGYKVETMWQHFLNNKKTSQGFIDWAFRVAITILLTFIAAKVGIKA